MKFAMFYLGEYGVALAYAGIITTLFLSGWQGPLLPGIIWFLIKVMLVFSVHRVDPRHSAQVPCRPVDVLCLESHAAHGGNQPGY